MSNYEYCQAESRSEVLLVTLNRPEVKNALHPPAHRELAEIFRDFQSNSAYRVAIITGAGDDAFSAGNDVKFSATATMEEMALPAEGFAGLTSFSDRTKPVIAAVNGFAYGGGFEIALASDLIVASATAKFALPEPKIGLAALAGGIHRLTRQIPYKKAMQMLMTGMSVSAVEGERFGFVNAVVAPEELIDASLEIAHQIAACSPVSIDITMRALKAGQQCLTPEELLDVDTKFAHQIIASHDFREGIAAFAEKRKPNWQGK